MKTSRGGGGHGNFGHPRESILDAWQAMISDHPTLLIADDDERFRSVLQEFLEPAGFRTLQASTGEEALDVVEVEPIDCLLLDNQLPGLTGLETLRLVRKLRETLPCIMITSDESQSVVRQALDLNAYTVLLKPVSRAIVTITVRRALRIPGPSK